MSAMSEFDSRLDELGCMELEYIGNGQCTVTLATVPHRNAGKVIKLMESIGYKVAGEDYRNMYAQIYFLPAAAFLVSQYI